MGCVSWLLEGSPSCFEGSWFQLVVFLFQYGVQFDILLNLVSQLCDFYHGLALHKLLEFRGLFDVHSLHVYSLVDLFKLSKVRISDRHYFVCDDLSQSLGYLLVFVGHVVTDLLSLHFKYPHLDLLDDLFRNFSLLFPILQYLLSNLFDFLCLISFNLFQVRFNLHCQELFVLGVFHLVSVQWLSNLLQVGIKLLEQLIYP